jgi:hypothetical protein
MEFCVVVRRVHREMQPVPAPELIWDYHRWMGGVDVHGQLRMQRYSVQLSYKTRKYYKTLFLGLFDMALVNAFIVFRHHKKLNDNRPQGKKRPPKHYAFFEALLEQLLAVDSAEAYDIIEVSYVDQAEIIVPEANFMCVMLALFASREQQQLARGQQLLLHVILPTSPSSRAYR